MNFYKPFAEKLEIKSKYPPEVLNLIAEYSDYDDYQKIKKLKILPKYSQLFITKENSNRYLVNAMRDNNCDLVFEILFSELADYAINNNQPIRWASKYNCIKVVDILLDKKQNHPEIYPTTFSLDDPFLTACLNSFYDIARMFIEYKVKYQDWKLFVKLNYGRNDEKIMNMLIKYKRELGISLRDQIDHRDFYRAMLLLRTKPMYALM